MTMRKTGMLILPLMCVAALTTGCPPVGDDMAPLPTPGDPNQPGAPQNPDPGQDPAPGDTDHEKPIAGVWKHLSGDFLDFETFGSNIEFVSFSESGLMSMSYRDPESNVLTCTESLFAKLSAESIFIDGGGGFASEGGGLGGLVFFDMANDDSLELIDDTQGTISTFERVAEIPEESRCGSLIEKARFDGLPELHYATGLAFDGTSLFYTTDANEILPIDPTTGTIGTPITFPTSPRFVHATQADDFWLISYGPTNTVATRRTRAGAEVDKVTGVELGVEVFTEAVAFDGTEKVLYAFGDDEANNRIPVLVKVDAEAEPDVLLDSSPFGNSLFDAMTMHDGSLFALSNYPPMVVQIDTTTLKAVKSFRIPDGFVEWDGIASVNGDLFLLGEDYTTREDLSIIARFEIAE